MEIDLSAINEYGKWASNMSQLENLLCINKSALDFMTNIYDFEGAVTGAFFTVNVLTGNMVLHMTFI